MSYPPAQRVALLGASGNLGRPLLAALLNDLHFQVTVISRTSSEASYDSRAVVVRVSDDFPKDEMVSVFTDHDAVIIAMAHAANIHHRTLIDAAVEAGVKHLIPNHWSSNAELPIIRQSSSRADALDKDIEYLRMREGSGMTWTAIVPGIFFDLAFPYGLLGFDICNRKAQIWDGGNASFSASTNEDIAAATIAVLRQPELVTNTYVYISSFETTQNQILSCAEKISGKEWDKEAVMRAEKIKQAQDTIAAGTQGLQWMMAQGTLAAASLFGGEEFQSDFVRSKRSSNQLLGLRPHDLNESVESFLKS